MRRRLTVGHGLVNDQLTGGEISALRTCEGVDLSLLLKNGFRFIPNKKIERALLEGLLVITENRLRATEVEWFRETSWSYEICESTTEIISTKKS